MNQHIVPAIPEYLRSFAEQFAASPGKMSKLIAYPDLVAKVSDLELSLADIGEEVGVSRECIRQTVDKYVPGIRPPEIRRTKTGRNCETQRADRAKRLTKKLEAKRAKAERAFKEKNRSYRLLRMHCKRAGLTLEVAKDEAHPSVRRYTISGKRTYVRVIGFASRVVTGRRYYAKAQEIDRDALKGFEQFAVIVHITKPKPTYAMYMISMRSYLRSGLESILIPLTKRHAGNRLECAVDWTANCVSSFPRNPE
jgi:hypothetical protein